MMKKLICFILGHDYQLRNIRGEKYVCLRCDNIKNLNVKSFSFLQMSFILILLFGCAPLQDNPPIPDDYQHENSSVVEPVVANMTNDTLTPPPPDIFLPIDDPMLFAVWILDLDKKGSFILTLNDKSLLINANENTIRTLNIIRNLGISRLDYLILENNHDDNIAGAAPIILRSKPVKVIHSGIPSSSYYYKQYNLLFPNTTVTPFDAQIGFADAIISLLVPYDDGQPLSDDNSILIKASYGNFNILFAGDCRTDCESRISDIYSTIVVSNGACDSLSYLFLKESSPDHIIFTAEPCPSTLQRVASLAIPVLMTPTDGDILITSNGISYDLQKSKTRK